LSEAPLVTVETLGLREAMPAKPTDAARKDRAIPLEEAVGNAERTHLLEALRETDWNVSRAAALLGISRNTLRYRIEKYGLRPGVSPAPPRVARAPAVEPAAPAAPPTAPGAPPAVRWEQRRLTLLRADLVSHSLERSSADSSRQLEIFVEKVQSFGGHVEELGLTGMVAAFGLEPI